MRSLAIETATAVCSVALFDGLECIAFAHDEVGRGHAERLIPMIATLPRGGRADRILVSCGPGSFTGLRVGIAAAKGLALAWDIPAFGFSTLSLLAAQCFETLEAKAEALVIINEGGHGELFVQRFDWGNPVGLALAESLTPEEAISRLQAGDRVAGTAALRIADLSHHSDFQNVLPDSRYAMCLGEDALVNAFSPIYIRAADAKPAAPQ